MYLSDPERRIFLAKMLKIPPALLGLTWQQVVYQDHAGTCTDVHHFDRATLQSEKRLNVFEPEAGQAVLVLNDNDSNSWVSK
jgi:hypothetical protein